MNKRVPKLTIPLCPYQQPGAKHPSQTKRIRPLDSLVFQDMMEQVIPNTITTLDIGARPWSVVNVFSPYSEDMHVMLIETSYNRCLTGPEDDFNESEIRLLPELFAAIAEFTANRESNNTVCIGYNWSPYSFGGKEEITGFQSLPTKTHIQIWGWPIYQSGSNWKFPQRKKKGWYVYCTPNRFEEELLNPPYGRAFGELIKHRIFSEGIIRDSNTLSSGILAQNPVDWRVDERGLEVKLRKPLTSALKEENFFRTVLQPIAILLKAVIIQLCSVFTQDDWQRIDKIVHRVAERPLNDEEIKFLQENPKIIDFHDTGDKVLDILAREVKGYIETRRKRDSWSRVEKEEMGCLDSNCWAICQQEKLCWRKGFGYSLVFSIPSRPKKDNYGAMRIFPGVHIGPGGVVEAQGVIIVRPEKSVAGIDYIYQRSVVLWQLKHELEKKFYIYDN